MLYVTKYGYAVLWRLDCSWLRSPDIERAVASVSLRIPAFRGQFFITRNTSAKTRALIKAAFDNSPDCSYIVRNRACSVSLNRTMTQCEAVSVFAGRPPRPLRVGLFFSIIEIFRVRLSPRRLLKIAIRSWQSRLSKSTDFGGAFIPLRASCFPLRK